MADIVSSLFGLPSEDLKRQLLQEQQNFATQFANTATTPSAQRRALLGGMVGNTLANFGAGLLGVQDPRLQRASSLEGILQSTQQELGEQANDPSVFYPQLQRKLNEGGFTREALQVGQVGQKAIQDAGVSLAQKRKLVAEASAKENETLREEQLRTALAGLPPNATEEDYLNIVRKYAPAKDVMSSIEKSQVAEENRKGKLEEIKFKAQEDQKRLEQTLEDKRLSREDKAEIQLQIAREANNTKLQIAQLMQSNKGLNLTPGQKRADIVFGEEYSNYIALGGKSVIDKQLKELDDVIKMIDVDKANVSGKDIAAAAALGDTALAAYSPKAVEARDKIGGVVQSNLREILGGQFAQKEGEALLARAYNLAVPSSDNLKRLKSLREQIQNAADAKEASVNYYEDKGTLLGFKPNQKADPLGIRKN